MDSKDFEMSTAIGYSLLLGIVSGVLTTALLWVIHVLWTKTIVPWYEQRVYKGVKIEGTWCLVDDSNDKDGHWAQREILGLKQTAHRLTGSLTLLPKEGENSDSIVLDAVGDISDRFVSLSFKSPIQDRLSYSVLLVEIVEDGHKLRGKTSMYNVLGGTIDSYSVEYKRQQ